MPSLAPIVSPSSSPANTGDSHLSDGPSNTTAAEGSALTQSLRLMHTLSPLKRKRDAPVQFIYDPTTSSSSSGSAQTPPRPHTMIIRIPMSSGSGSDDRLSAPPVPPSPTPTEIIAEPIRIVNQLEIVETAKAAGIKVRDFAYEPGLKANHVPDVWRYPLHTLIMHDRYIRSGPSTAPSFKLPGKMLWRLLHSGLVTHEEAKRNWSEADWRELEAYKARPGGPYPYMKISVAKPSASLRAQMRLDAYPPAQDDIPEERIYTPPDEPVTTDDAVPEEKPAEQSAEADEDDGDRKKRKVGVEGTPSPARSRTSSPQRAVSPVPDNIPSRGTVVSDSPLVNNQDSRSDSSRRSPTPPPKEPVQEPKPRRPLRGLERTRTMVWSRDLT